MKSKFPFPNKKINKKQESGTSTGETGLRPPAHTPTLHWMKGLSRTKMGMRVLTMKSMKSQKARPPTFLRAISFTCRLSRYHWFPRERSKHTSTTFRAARSTTQSLCGERWTVSLQLADEASLSASLSSAPLQ